MQGIYAIRQISTGKQYVGSSMDIDTRWRQHKNALQRGCHHSIYLQRAYDKYGELDFEHVVLESCIDWSAEIQLKRENHWIQRLKPEFNVSPVAGSPLGVKRSPETIARMKAALKGRVSPRKGVKLSAETIQKIVKAKTGLKQSQETKDKRAASLRGLLRTPEQRANISKAKKGKRFTEAHKLALSIAAKSREAREK